MYLTDQGEGARYNKRTTNEREVKVWITHWHSSTRRCQGAS